MPVVGLHRLFCDLTQQQAHERRRWTTADMARVVWRRSVAERVALGQSARAEALAASPRYNIHHRKTTDQPTVSYCNLPLPPQS